MQVWDNTFHWHIVQFDINTFTVQFSFLFLFFCNEDRVFLFVFRNDCLNRNRLTSEQFRCMFRNMNTTNLFQS
uniref:Uncharacterized protein n=1 Tax=Arundo donax TaxID=35708 RepID=A0A0A8ZPJ7_ARUDO